MLSSLFATMTETTISLNNLLIAMFTALVMGLLNSLVYMKTNRYKAPSQSFSITLIILPAVIAVIILLVGSNVASAFSLAGAFSIIRFRSEAGDPKDLTYVLLSMAIGLACGTGFILYAVIVGFILCCIMAIFELTGFGLSKTSAKLLKITVPENCDYNRVFEDIFNKYTVSHTLARVKTTELGSLYEIIYDVIIRDNISEKELIDEIRCRNGNLNISLILQIQNMQSF